MARPPGSKGTLPHGIAKLVHAARQAEKLGIRCDEAWGTIHGIMRGEISGRYVGDRLRAAIFTIEQEIGKAKQKIEVEDKSERSVFRAKFSEGPDIHPPTTKELPN